MKKSLFLASFVAATLLSACGGGSSGSDSGVLIEGTLVEAGGAGHKIASLKHSSGQTIESVTICALGECSTTDEAGQWGFLVDEAALGSAALFTINGHGIDAQTAVELPAQGSEIFIGFAHVEGGLIAVNHMTVDGAAVDSETEHSHDDESAEHAH